VNSAVVFAYGDVGVRCIEVLRSGGIDVRLIVTHADDPAETRWYASVAELAAERSLPCTTANPGTDPALLRRIAALAPDFIFSFYYRALLPAALLGYARRGALNMHGSLLPRFRGRAPVNWAVLRGAKETGATLHYMVERADAGDIVDQEAVPILADDDALTVFRKVTVAAEIVLARSLPRLIAGSARRIPQRLSDGEYCGRRRPEDGRIDWSRPAREIHNLVRAVAPPFPGAFTEVSGERWTLTRTRVLTERGDSTGTTAVLHGRGGHCLITCTDGGMLELLGASTAGGPIDLAAQAARLELAPCALG
jgi:methionyl-tRNA formyltransferase